MTIVGEEDRNLENQSSLVKYITTARLLRGTIRKVLLPRGFVYVTLGLLIIKKTNQADY
jgi:hypothetical protein